MTQEDKIRIDFARLQGEFIGTLKGIMFNDIPKELKMKLQRKVVELENNTNI